MTRHRIPGTDFDIVFGQGVIVRPVDLSPTQWTLLHEAAASARLGHRSYVPPGKVVCKRAASLLVKMGLARWTTRFRTKSIAITDLGRQVLGILPPRPRPKLRAIEGGRK